MDNSKIKSQMTEMDLVLSRIEHVFEHSTQDDDVIAAVTFKLFLRSMTEMGDSSFLLCMKKITDIRNYLRKVQQESE